MSLSPGLHAARGACAPGTRFRRDGFAVLPHVLPMPARWLAQRLVDQLVARHRAGDAAVVAHSVAFEDGVAPGEPFILGDLVALDRRFAHVLSASSLWWWASRLLGCTCAEVRFHFANVTRKPPGHHRALAWHRDAGNAYFSTLDDRTVRLLLPLQPMSSRNGGTAVVAGSHRTTALDAQPDRQSCPGVPAGAGLALHARVLHGGGPNLGVIAREVVVVQFGRAGAMLRHRADECLALCGRAAFLRGRMAGEAVPLQD